MNEKRILHPAIFLDRDGTITPEVGYVLHPCKLTLLPGAADAIKRLSAAGFKVIVITNQSAVARGLMDIETLHAMNRRLNDLLTEEGARLDGLYFCPHHPAEGKGEFTRLCDCRKPAPGLFIKAAEELRVDLSKSYIIGDKLSDISMAPALKAKGILVKTGYGESELELLSSSNAFPPDSDLPFRPDYIAGDISGAAGWIVLQSE